MMAQTSQYGLRQWEANEVPRHRDFNQAMVEVDQALLGAVTGVNEALSKAAADLKEDITGLRGEVSALEIAQASKAEYLTGTYVGNGTNSRVISLGRTPKAVLLENKEGERFWDGLCRMGGLALTGLPFGDNDPPYMAIQTGGFTVSAVETNYGTNANGFTYYYLALL